MKKNLHSKEKWKGAIRTTKKPKSLKLQEDINGFFFCLIYQGDREGFHSERGCCKYVFNKHECYQYYDKKPEVSKVFSLRNTHDTFISYLEELKQTKL